MVTDDRIKDLAVEFFGNSPLPVHYYDAIRAFLREGYRKGFQDGMVQAQIPDPFMEVQGG